MIHQSGLTSLRDQEEGSERFQKLGVAQDLLGSGFLALPAADAEVELVIPSLSGITVGFPQAQTGGARWVSRNAEALVFVQAEVGWADCHSAGAASEAGAAGAGGDWLEGNLTGEELGDLDSFFTDMDHETAGLADELITGPSP